MKKKILLSLGAIATAVTPLAVVVSCGGSDKKTGVQSVDLGSIGIIGIKSSDNGLKITSDLPKGVLVQYKKDGTTEWQDMNNPKVGVKGLTSGAKYDVRIVSRNKDKYKLSGIPTLKVQTIVASTPEEIKTAALATAKEDAKEYIKQQVAKLTKHPVRDAAKLKAVSEAVEKAKKAIDAATTAAAAQALATSATTGSEIAKVKTAVDNYNSQVTVPTIDASTPVGEAKAKAIAFINSIKIPVKEDSKHSSTFHDSIIYAKRKAIASINAATSVADINALATSATTGTADAKILAAINEYKESKVYDLSAYTVDDMFNERGRGELRFMVSKNGEETSLPAGTEIVYKTCAPGKWRDESVRKAPWQSVPARGYIKPVDFTKEYHFMVKSTDWSKYVIREEANYPEPTTYVKPNPSV